MPRYVVRLPHGLRRHVGRLEPRTTKLVAVLVVSEGVFRIEPDRLNVVGDRIVEVAVALVPLSLVHCRRRRRIFLATVRTESRRCSP